MFFSMKVGVPGAQGPGKTGTQGMGVSTPSAAAVAAATVGLAGLLHMPNGGMFTIGMLSMMLAAAMLLVIIWFLGSTLNVLGAAPKVQASIAPVQTC